MLENDQIKIESLIDEQYRYMFHQVLKDFKPEASQLPASLRQLCELNVSEMIANKNMVTFFGLINTDYYSQTKQMFRSIIND